MVINCKCFIILLAPIPKNLMSSASLHTTFLVCINTGTSPVAVAVVVVVAVVVAVVVVIVVVVVKSRLF